MEPALGRLKVKLQALDVIRNLRYLLRRDEGVHVLCDLMRRVMSEIGLL